MAPSAYQSKRISTILSLVIPFAAALMALPLSASPGHALEAAIVKGLRELDLSARLEQRCDIEAMNRISHDMKTYRPDRVVAGATAATKVDGDSLVGDGAAFRSKGKWYRLSYVCKTSDDHLDVIDFSYEVGDAIPESDWEKYELWD